MPPSEGTSSKEITGYEFGDAMAPEGFDPEAAGYSDPTIGWHPFTIDEFWIEENKVFKGKDFDQYVGTQLRVRLKVPQGQPEAGASVLDFIPMPSPGRPMPRALANRWANFIAAFGFRPPTDKLVPAGFKLHSLIGAQGACEIIEDEYEGKKRLKPKFFGYKPVSEMPTGNGNGKKANGKTNGGNGGGTASKAPPATVSAPDLDNL